MIFFFKKKRLSASNKVDNPGVKHWYYQKLSSLVMLPLTIWLIIKLPLFISLNYKSKVIWLTDFPNFLILILFYIVASFHMKLGLSVVIEDYIHNNKMKNFFITFITIFSFILPVKVFVLILLMRS